MRTAVVGVPGLAGTGIVHDERIILLQHDRVVQGPRPERGPVVHRDHAVPARVEQNDLVVQQRIEDVLVAKLELRTALVEQRMRPRHQILGPHPAEVHDEDARIHIGARQGQADGLA